jgi:site-specific recombinase XerD
MGNFKDYLQSKRHSKINIEKSYYSLHNYLDWCEKEKIESEFATYNEILSYLKQVQKRGITKSTTYKYLNSIKHYYNWLIKEGKREENPCREIKIKGIKGKQIHDILNRQELEQLYHTSAAETLTEKRNRVIVGLLIWQGITTKELANLTVKAVDLRAGNVFVSGSRTSNERTLKLDAQQILDLMEYSLTSRKELLQLSGKESDLLIVSSGKSHLIINTMAKLLKKLQRQNPRIKSVHQIRASVITHWLKLYNLRETQYKAGHRYVGSTEAYQINDLDDLQEDINKYHPF